MCVGVSDGEINVITLAQFEKGRVLCLARMALCILRAPKNAGGNHEREAVLLLAI